MSPENQNDQERRQDIIPYEFELPESYGRNAITGFPDRLALDHAVLSATVTMPGRFGVVAADVEGLKKRNDELGHEAGNELLRKTTTIIETELRDNDAVAVVTHPGGDEITFLVGDVESDEQVTAVIERLQATLDSQGIHVSMGGRVHKPGEDVNELINDADKLMYGNKIERKLQSYTPEQLSLMRELAKAAISANIDLRDIPTLLSHISE